MLVASDFMKESSLFFYFVGREKISICIYCYYSFVSKNTFILFLIFLGERVREGYK